MFTEIPKIGFSGWMCTFRADRTYDCSGYFVPENIYNQGVRPDFKSGQFVGSGFNCVIDQTHPDEDYASCTAWLPKEGVADSEGEYRW